jgi:glyoxylase-like metal-dependent hydrolase (beta-lactamase superfamily II)
MAILDTFTYHDLDAHRVGRFDLGINSSFICYRLQDTLIDCGPSNQWKYVKPFVEAKPFKQILLTHHHEDHSGNAGSIYQLSGVQPQAPDITIDIMKRGFKIPLVQKVLWGSANRVEAVPLPADLTIGDEVVAPIFTPGHAKDMTCYLLKDRGWLFSADLYIANHLKFLRIDEHIPTLLNSTQQALNCEFETLICPHRGVVENGKKKLQEKYDYLVELSTNAQAQHQAGVELLQITDQLLGKEGLMSKLSGYNFSKRNLIRSCLEVDLTAV